MKRDDRMNRRGRMAGGSGSARRSGVGPDRGRGRNRLRPGILALEDRRLLSASTTFDVTSIGDSTGTPADGTLRWAVEQANAATSPVVIDFQLSTLPATITLASFSSPLELSNTSEPITIAGPGASELTLDANGIGAALRIDAGVTATLTGLTVTGATLDAVNPGAVSNFGTLSISNCTLSGNSISGLYDGGSAIVSDCTIAGNNDFFGAGVYVKGAGSTALISACQIENNLGSRGAGIANVLGTAMVTSCTITGDSALGGGGGLYNSGGLKVYDSTIGSDTGGGGGGLYNLKGGTASLYSSTISNGSGFIDGGNLDNQYGGTLNLSDCVVSGGSAEIGGGLYNAGTATISQTTISGNTATGASGGGQGGGIANGPLQSKAVVNITASTLSGNTAKLGGGGLYNAGTANLADDTIAENFANQAGSLLASDGGGVDSTGVAELVACTITGNTTTAKGGGVYNGGLGENAMVLDDTIIAGNLSQPSSTAPATADDITVGTSTNGSYYVSGSYDLVGSGGAGGLNLSTTNNQNNQGNEIGVNPMLAPLGNYGGPTPTVALLPGSPAIGAGSVFKDAQGNPITVDQRGEPLDSPPDMGAYQTQGFILTPVAGSTPQTAYVGQAFANPLAFTVTSRDGTEPVSGGTVKFNIPTTGATASLSATTAEIGANGQVSVDATAGSIPGSYGVLAQVAGTTDETEFLLTNELIPLTFNVPSDTTISYGSSATFSGTLSNGTFYPPASRESVTVSVGGDSGTGTIGADGAFSVTVNTGTLSAGYSPYAVTYSYAGDGTFGAAATNTMLTIDPATPTITWANPADITYGTALGTTQLDATSPVPGTFSYTPAPGTILKAGSGQTLSVTFTPTDTTDYTTATATATINVDPATPTITWANPAGITYGTALGTTQLDATTTVPGTFTYTPALGTVLGAGSHQTLSVTFTPTDTTDYTSTTATTTINVAQATPTITWANPSEITYGTALGATQLDASASVPGTFIYTPALGTVLKAGNDQTLSVTFTPTDSTDYASTTATATISVAQVTPTITWANPTGITYGTALGAAQLDASASVPGTFRYTPAPGTVLGAGSNQTLSVTFTPTDSTDYTTASATATINVAQATPTITWANPADITYGTALGSTQLDAASPVPGTFTYTPPTGTVLNVGLGQTLSVTFTPTDTADYISTTATATINVDRATPTITWATPADITYGTALGATQLDATSPVSGTFSYTPAAGTVLGAGSNQTLSVTFTPTDTVDYAPATATTTIGIDRATPTLSVSATGGTYDSSPYAASVTVGGTGSQNKAAASLEDVSPTLTYYVGTGTTGTDLGSSPPSLPGTYTVVASFPGSADYAPTVASPLTFTITPAASSVSLSVSGGTSSYGEAVTLTATVTGGPSPGGTVTFYDVGTALGTAPVDATGHATLTTTALTVGTDAISAAYSGDAGHLAATSAADPATVSPSATQVTLDPQPVLKGKKVVSLNLEAEVQPTAPGGGVPTGTVTFELITTGKGKHAKTRVKVLGTSALSGGTATLAVKPNQVLKKTIKVLYSGDPDFLSGTATPPALTKASLKALERPMVEWQQRGRVGR